MSEMKLIMESWNSYLNEGIQKPTTWGELAQNIMLNTAATKWPRIGRTLARLGFKLATGAAKQAYDAIEGLEDVLDYIPDDKQAKLEQGAEDAAQWLTATAKQRGGVIGAYIVDDVMGMDDSLSKKVVGFDQLQLDDEYEQLVDKTMLKKWAIGIIRKAKEMNPDTPLPNLNRELELYFQQQTGAHPDTDEPDVRK